MTKLISGLDAGPKGALNDVMKSLTKVASQNEPKEEEMDNSIVVWKGACWDGQRHRCLIWVALFFKLSIISPDKLCHRNQIGLVCSLVRAFIRSSVCRPVFLSVLKIAKMRRIFAQTGLLIRKSLKSWFSVNFVISVHQWFSVHFHPHSNANIPWIREYLAITVEKNLCLFWYMSRISSS